MIQNSARPLVISMGLNGYQWTWKRAIASHKAYCKKYGYDYVFVQKPSFTPLKGECAWLKVPLLLSALNAGRQWVMYIDCDAAISERCPPFLSVDDTDKCLFMANGFSGRVNSGVIVIHNNNRVRALLETILANALRPVPEEDNVGWGENGHIISFSKSFSGLKILGTEWNNNQNPDLKDFIRHYSSGPMRQNYYFTRFELMAGGLATAYCRILAKLHRISAKFQQKPYGQRFYRNLDTLMKISLRNYPPLRGTRSKHH